MIAESALLDRGDAIGVSSQSHSPAPPATAASLGATQSSDAMEVTESVPTNKEANAEEDKMEE